MGLRDRFLNKAKTLLGREEKKGSGLNAQGLPSQPNGDGYRAVCKAAAIAEGKPGTFQAPNGRVAAVFRHQGKLYCVDNECRHEDGPVGEGTITGTRVRCPYHDWEYDFISGVCTSHPENRLETYHVREGEGFIWIGPILAEGTSMRGGEHNDGMKVIVK
jgi:nitrite reductase/ring-hydroxylating ferredoxin subunit